MDAHPNEADSLGANGFDLNLDEPLNGSVFRSPKIPRPRTSTRATRSHPVSVAQSEPVPSPTAAHEATARYILACAGIDGETTIERCIAAGITPEAFPSRLHRSIWELFVRMYDNGARQIDGAKAWVEIQKTGMQISLSEFSEATDAGSTTADIGDYIDLLLSDWKRHEIVKLADWIRQRGLDNADPAEIADEVRRRLGSVTTGEVRENLRPITSFAIPSDTDPSILLGNRYLNRGDGAVLASGSGVGKSSISLQAAVTWSLNRPFFGIRPNGPLRSLVVQAEDTDGDVAEVWESLKHGLKISPEEEAITRERVAIVTDRTHRGESFIRLLRALIKRFKPDLVWINPLFAFLDGDVNDARDAGKFLREGLNGLNEPATFGYFIVHHTSKPPSPKDRGERRWNEVQYDMSGSAELTNWARAVLSLRPTANEGEFNLVLAKRGRRAGVTKEVQHQASVRHEPTTTIPLRHSQEMIQLPERSKPLHAIFWEPRVEESTEGAGDGEERKKSNRGRPAKYPFMDFQAKFSAHIKGREKRQTYAMIRRLAKEVRHIPNGSFNDILDRWLEDGFLISDTEDGRYFVR